MRRLSMKVTGQIKRLKTESSRISEGNKIKKEEEKEAPMQKWKFRLQVRESMKQ